MGAVIEFLDRLPHLISAGHDGFFPYERHPYDQVFVIAYRWSADPIEQEVEFWLPNNHSVALNNRTNYSDQIRVHRSGFLWHDRVREIEVTKDSRWLSEFGFTSVDPRINDQDRSSLFAVLPGSPMRDLLEDLLASKKWRDIRDFHTRNREWMPTNIPKVSSREARRYERDAALIADLKRARGSECQICGFTFKKADGSEYCEVHHLEGLANGGLDVAANCLVLCANCHKRFHYGNIQIVSHTSNRLAVAIDGERHDCIVG